MKHGVAIGNASNHACYVIIRLCFALHYLLAYVKCLFALLRLALPTCLYKVLVRSLTFYLLHIKLSSENSLLYLIYIQVHQNLYWFLASR